MRLLFLLDSFGSGGAQRQMTALAAGLHDRGFEIEFFLYYPKYQHFAADIRARNIKVYEFNKSWRYDHRILFELRKLTSGGKYQGILSFLRTPNVYAELLRLFRPTMPVIVSERSSYPYGKVSMGRKIREQLHRLSSHVIVNSYYQRDKMIEVHPWIKSKITTIYNGVNLNLYTPSGNGEISHPPRFLVIATIRALKNVVGLAKALVSYAKSYGDPPIINWVGKKSANWTDQKALKESVEILERTQLRNRWNWLGERSDIVELLQNHDALILPSFYEGLSNAICEALACGKPVLASNVCDNPRLVQEGKTGFLFNPNDPDNIANTIHRFVTLSTEERVRMGHNARAFAESNLAMDLFIRRYMDLFETVLMS